MLRFPLPSSARAIIGDYGFRKANSFTTRRVFLRILGAYRLIRGLIIHSLFRCVNINWAWVSHQLCKTIPRRGDDADVNSTSVLCQRLRSHLIECRLWLLSPSHNAEAPHIPQLVDRKPDWGKPGSTYYQLNYWACGSRRQATYSVAGRIKTTVHICPGGQLTLIPSVIRTLLSSPPILEVRRVFETAHLHTFPSGIFAF